MYLKFQKRDIFLFSAGLLVFGIVYYAFLRPGDFASQSPDLSLDKKGLSHYHKKEVNNTIRKNRNAIQACYNRFLETKPNISEGKIHLDWQIEPDGEVEKVEVVASEFQAEEIASCLKKEISGWEFPPPPERKRNTYADYTFHFLKEENLPSPEDKAPQMINTPRK